MAMVIDGVLHGACDVVGPWVQRNLGGSDLNVPYVTHGLLNAEGQLVFGCMWFNHRDDEVEVAMFATDIRPAMPQVFRAILAYPFDVLKVTRINAEIDVENKRVIRFAEGIGMKRDCVKRGTTKALYGMMRGDCPFLKEVEDGQSAIPAITH